MVVHSRRNAVEEIYICICFKFKLDGMYVYHCALRVMYRKRYFQTKTEEKILDSWIKRDQLDVTSFFISLSMFRMLILPSSGACDLFVESFHGLYCSGTMCVGVTVWFGWGGVVWYPYAGWSTTSACIRRRRCNSFWNLFWNKTLYVSDRGTARNM